MIPQFEPSGRGRGPVMAGSLPVVLITTQASGRDTRDTDNSAWAGLLAAELEQFRSLRTHRVGLESGDVTGFWDVVDRVRPDVAVVLEPTSSPLFARVRASRPNAGGPIVVSGNDASSISMTAAALLAVNRRREATGTARVLLAGADRLPGLNSLLALASIGELTLWHSTDAASFPLRTAAGGVDVVMNLLGPDAAAHFDSVEDTDATDRRRPPVVLEPDHLADPFLVLPGLVHTLTAATVRDISADLTGFDPDYHDMCFAAALELVMATPRDQAQLPRPSRQLAARIAEATARALLPARRAPSTGQTNRPLRDRDR